MTVHDLLQAVMLPSANDAAATLAVCAAGSRAAFVARMNLRAQALGLRHTHFTTPIGLDDPGNYATAADLARLAIAARKDGFLRRTMDLPQRRPAHRRHPRTSSTATRSCARCPWIDGVKTGHTNAAGFILVASGTRARADVRRDRARRPQRGRARRRRARAAEVGVRELPARDAGDARRQVEARPRVRFRPDERIDVIAAARGARPAPAQRRDPRHDLGPARARRPAAAPRASSARSRSARTGARSPACRSDARSVPAVGLLERLGARSDGPGSLIAIAALLGGAAVLLARRAEGRRQRRRRADMEAA